MLAAGIGVAAGGFILIFGYMNRQLLDPPLGIFYVVVPAILIVSFAIGIRLKTWGERFGVFAGIAWVGMAGSAVLLFGYLPALNAWLDDSSSQTHRAEIVEKRRKKGSRIPIRVESWRVAGDREFMWAPASLVKDATHVTITTRAGFFGFEWVDKIAR